MNFFERQAAARRNSTRLLVLFGLAVIGIVVAVDAGLAMVFGPDPRVLLLGTVATPLVIGLGSLYRVSSLSDGGEVIARQLGGTEVAPDTTDFNLRRLHNVVEEIAIASGVPMPRLFVLEREAGINAFAAGYSPADAAIAVTRGALERLNRDELQGVIAHEFSHILNGDMRLNIRLIGVLFGILMIGLAGRKLLENAGRTRRSSGAFFVGALALMLIGYVGLFFGRMIKAGISRSREVLADASAVQFTRHAAGLAGALKKIGGLAEGARLSHRDDAEEVSHMLFGDGVGFSGLFATHPPLLARIQALEPGFDARLLDGLRQRWTASPPSGIAEDRLLGFAEGAAPAALPAATRELALAPAQVVGQVGQPAEDDYRAASDIIATLPDALRKLATTREDAMGVTLGLLLSRDADIAERQHGLIAQHLGDSVARQASELAALVLNHLHPMLRLPLAALAFPALRLQPAATLDAFMAACEAVSHADGEVTLFDYCLARMLQVQVREAVAPPRHGSFGLRKLATLKPEIAKLLAVLARHGHADPSHARRAYLDGIGRIFPREALPYPELRGGVQVLDSLWLPLDRLEPPGKQLLIEAITATVSHDGRVSVAESELLRAVCAIIHCPLPPILHD